MPITSIPDDYANYINSVSWDDLVMDPAGAPTPRPTMNNQELYARLRNRGRDVILSGDTIYEFIDGEAYLLDANGERKEAETVAAPKAKKKPVLDLKAIKYELEDCLLHVMKGHADLLKRDYISCSQTTGNQQFRHNYERHEAENRQMYVIKFKRCPLALVQRYPHKRATVYKQTKPENILVQRLLESVLYYSLPEAKTSVQALDDSADEPVGLTYGRIRVDRLPF